MQPNRRTFIQRSSLVTAGLLGTASTTNAAGAASVTSEETGHVEGTITYGDHPLADIDVLFSDEYSAETDGSGSYERDLEPGWYTLTVAADGYATETQTIEVTTDETVTVDFGLEREWGPGEGEFDVYVTEVGGGPTLECLVTIYGNGEEHSVVAPGGTIPDGDKWERGFVVPEGWWEIRVSGIDDYGDGYDEVYVEEDGFTRSRIQVPDEDRTIHHNGWVTGTVTDDADEPIPEARVTVIDDTTRTATTTATTSADGEFTIELDHGEYMMVVEADGYEPGRTDAVVRFGRLTEQHVTLEPQLPESL
ncbi:PEGA domain-containing protein [Natronorubrum sp. JWXQ-INN-674]|uniref:PEGA domain-containing protein n=1 Tax=Natronorubrum halalkaliphilum TaxID=2691917 RepID=A0A6B0VN15_9EURY|nr:carboxypeptidase-like regulatory domain-containing protein [Natronorubrum halalkaliphilum]MXV62507.1 PEGA domain-containing protein [Natronorubrum halalkaliphilum]